MNTTQKDKDYQPEALRLILKDWFQVLTHVHSPLGTWAFRDRSNAAILQNWQDGKMPLPIIVDRVSNLFGEGNGSAIVDSDHAFHALNCYHDGRYPAEFIDPASGERLTRIELLRRDRVAAFSSENIDQTIKVISDATDIRRRLIEGIRQSLGKEIYTGIEADILGKEINGRYYLCTVAPEIRKRLDVVTASYHHGIYLEAHDIPYGGDFDLDLIKEVYLKLTADPAVDVIGHFMREIPLLPLQAKLSENPGYFDDVFHGLKENNKALELCLKDLVDPEMEERNRLFFSLLRRAKAMEVYFILGTDFHRIGPYIRMDFPTGLPASSAFAEDHGCKTMDECECFCFGGISLSRSAEKIPRVLTRGASSDSDNQLLDYLDQVGEDPENPGKEKFLPEHSFRSEEEARQFEESYSRNLNLFLLKDQQLGLRRLSWSVCWIIHQLEDNGIFANDILGGSKELFNKWVEKRKTQKQ